MPSTWITVVMRAKRSLYAARHHSLDVFCLASRRRWGHESRTGCTSRVSLRHTTVASCHTGLTRSGQFRGTTAKTTRQRQARRLLGLVKVSAMIDVPTPTRILAIEPDPPRGAVLYG